MSLVRPINFQIPRKEFELRAGWSNKLRSLDLEGVTIDDDVVQQLEGWLRCYVDMLHIASFSAGKKEVLRALRRIASEAQRKSRASERSASSSSIFQHSDDVTKKRNRAKNIALDYVGLGLLTDKKDRSIYNTDHRARVTPELIRSTSMTSNGLDRIAHHSSLTRQLLSRPNRVIAKLMEPMEGKELFGIPFHYQPDPHLERHFRASQECIDTLASALCLIYRAAGGKPYVPRDGRSPNSFMKFVHAACEAIPSQRPTLESSCRRVLRLAKVQGWQAVEAIINQQVAR